MSNDTKSNTGEESPLSVGFLGAGKMATALAKGFVHAGLVTPSKIIASDPHGGARDAFAKEVGSECKITGSNLDVVKEADILFIAVKPDQVDPLLEEIRGSFVPKRHLLISIAAGITIARLSKGLSRNGARIVRVMPNTPALVGASASAYALKPTSESENDAKIVQKLMSAVGVAAKVEEKHLDAVTGLSGSGPAYIYLIIEALSDGGVAAGLPRDIATQFAAQTVLGSAKMVLETGMHPGALKDMVTSPGGTTIEGLHKLELGGVRGSLINAVRAASEKATKLGEK